MQPESLPFIVKERLIDDMPAEDERLLLRALARAYGPARKRRPLSPPETSFADGRYTAGKLLPKAYCYLAWCSKILEICTRRGAGIRPPAARLWGYVFWSAMDEDERAEFGRALAADLSTAITEEEARVSDHPLRETVTSMLRALLREDDRDGLREVVRWAYGAYEPYWKILLEESHDDDRWLTNVAELLPRLLLKNCIPLHDAVVVRNPQIVIAEYTSATLPPALTDPGLLLRRSALVRTLFTEREIHALEQAGQRISELFAHAYPILLIADVRQNAADMRERVRAMTVQRGRIRTLEHLETQYSHSRRIPTWLYLELRRELLGRRAG